MDAAVLVEPSGDRRAYVQADHRVCLLDHQNESAIATPRQAVQQRESRAGGAGYLVEALRQVRLVYVVAYESHRLQPGSRERGMFRLSDFGGRMRHSIFEFLLRVAAVSVGPRSHAAAVGGIEPTYSAPEWIRDDYLSAYLGDRFVESMRYVRAYPTELPILAGLLPTIETPVEIIAGVRDAAIPPSNAEFLHARLPKSKLDIIDAGHFTWEDNADAYASLVTSWWSGGYARV
jgi:pimeloyl-ACP methyl ester carboxylesterase